MPRALFQAAAVLSISLGSACAAPAGAASTAGQAVSADDLVPIPAPTETELVRPVTAAEADLLDRAEQTLIRACMEKHGYKSFVLPREPVPGWREFPYVVDDVAWAARYGYGFALARQAQAATENDANETYFRSLTPQAAAAARKIRNGDATTGDLLVAGVDGVPDTRGSSDSCLFEAETQLYGDGRLWFRVRTVDITLEMMRRGGVEADAGFLAAVRVWSRCLHGEGYDYASPAQARAGAMAAEAAGPQGPGLAGAGAAEKKLAVAEATCAGRSGLTGAIRQAEDRQAEIVRAGYPGDVAAKRRLELEALPRARAIVAAG